MKLVDILARELKDWPDDYLVEKITQDSDCMVFGWSEADPEMDDGYWVFSKRSKLTDWRPGEFAMAEDRNNALVTRAQWQAAVDALAKHEFIREGIPNIGTICEGRVKNGGHWRKYTVKAMSTDFLIVWCEQDLAETPIRHAYWEFRPIRTAEQIAAEERENAIREMTALTEHEGLKCWAEYVYDRLGYRKQEVQK